jgi:hypothetical protein
MTILTPALSWLMSNIHKVELMLKIEKLRLIVKHPRLTTNLKALNGFPSLANDQAGFRSRDHDLLN